MVRLAGEIDRHGRHILAFGSHAIFADLAAGYVLAESNYIRALLHRPSKRSSR